MSSGRALSFRSEAWRSLRNVPCATCSISVFDLTCRTVPRCVVRIDSGSGDLKPWLTDRLRLTDGVRLTDSAVRVETGCSHLSSHARSEWPWLAGSYADKLTLRARSSRLYVAHPARHS